MFGLEMLDVAIGMIFVFLLLSLICSAVNEMIEAYLKKRATDLERGIRELLNDPSGTGLVKKLYDHPLVIGLFRGTYDPGKISGGRYRTDGDSLLPSYIPARNFALALMDVVLPATPTVQSGADNATTPPPDPKAPPPSDSPLQPLRNAISTIRNPKVEQALMTLVDAAGDDVGKARENIEAWYDSTMDRVAGWYKRRAQVIIFFLGLGVAIAVNADTITISNSLSHDEALRNSLVAAAQEYAKANASSSPSPSPSPAAESKIEACKKDANSPECRLETNLAKIRNLGLPVGWNRDDPRTIPDTVGGWVIKLIGWLLTAIAISLGAPFWFDLLNKFMVVRSTVKPHEKSPEEESEA